MLGNLPTLTESDVANLASWQVGKLASWGRQKKLPKDSKEGVSKVCHPGETLRSCASTLHIAPKCLSGRVTHRIGEPMHWFVR